MFKESTLQFVEANNSTINPADMFYDWFCSDTALTGRGQRLLTKLNSIIDSPKFNKGNMYVFFKNNCPMVGNLYDDFRICSVETGEVLYTVTPSDGHTKSKGKSQVYGRENKFDVPLVSGTWDDVKKYFHK